MYDDIKGFVGLKIGLKKLVNIDDHETYNLQTENLLPKPKPVDDTIERVYAYKVPLYKQQLSEKIVCHVFIVFRTKKWWWSIEKHTDGITIQRSQNEKAVVNSFRKEPRNRKATLVLEDESECFVHGLIDWIYEKGLLYDEYDLVESNCKDFAKVVFNHLAINRQLNITLSDMFESGEHSDLQNSWEKRSYRRLYEKRPQ